MEGKIVTGADLLTRASGTLQGEEAQEMSAEEITDVITEHIIDAASKLVGAFIANAKEAGVLTDEDVQKIYDHEDEQLRKELTEHIEEHEADGTEPCITREFIEGEIAKSRERRKRAEEE